MTLLKEIGAILGLVAFGGMSVLAFLTFQQARHVRRLREWAGRSPERAAVEADRVSGAATEAAAARAAALEEPADRGPGRMERLRGEFAFRWEELDRRSPIDAKILLGALVVVLVGVGILTSGFGLLGGGSSESPAPAPVPQATEPGGKKPAPSVKVAVLNGTAPATGGSGVPGIADTASTFVEAAGFDVGKVSDAGPFATSVVMYKDGFESDAAELAKVLEPQLGATETEPITPEIEALVGKAEVALVVGADDQGI